MAKIRVSEQKALEVATEFFKDHDWEHLLKNVEWYCYRLGRRGAQPKKLFLQTLSEVLDKHTLVASAKTIKEYTVISVSTDNEQQATRVVKILENLKEDRCSESPTK